MKSFTVGLIGCGNRSRGHVEAVDRHEGLNLIAVADADEERRMTAAERMKVQRYADGAEMLAAEKPDVAIICTREDPRYDLTVAAVEAGVKAISLEKPMARTVAQAREMVRLCEERNVILTVSHQMRFADEFTAERDALRQSAIGKPYFMRASSYGQLMEQGPHMVDMLLFLSGNAKPEWVMGSVGDLVDGLETVHPAPAFTVAYVAFDSGLRVVLECGRNAAMPVGMEGENWATKRVQILGTEGTLDAVVMHYCKIMNTAQAGWKTLALGRDGWDNATIAYYAELYESLANGTPHRNNGEESLRGFEIIHAVYQSAWTQERVDLPLAEDVGALDKFMARARATKATSE